MDDVAHPGRQRVDRCVDVAVSALRRASHITRRSASRALDPQPTGRVSVQSDHTMSVLDLIGEHHCHGRRMMPCSSPCSGTMQQTRRCIRGCTSISAPPMCRCWRYGVAATRSSVPQVRQRLRPIYPMPISTCSTADTSYWSPTCGLLPADGSGPRQPNCSGKVRPVRRAVDPRLHTAVR